MFFDALDVVVLRLLVGRGECSKGAMDDQYTTLHDMQSSKIEAGRVGWVLQRLFGRVEKVSRGASLTSRGFVSKRRPETLQTTGRPTNHKYSVPSSLYISNSCITLVKRFYHSVFSDSGGPSSHGHVSHSSNLSG